MMATLYGLSPEQGTELWAHDFEGFAWGSLPERCVMQLHWLPTEPFRARLKTDGVRVVMIHRHPLDVLISILQLARHTPETGQWLLGSGGVESVIQGARPRSEAFLNYATGPRASALLNVSLAWRRTSGTVTVGYEDLVGKTVAELTRITQTFQRMPTDAVARAVDACTIERLRNPSNAPHFWQGKSGLWRKLLTANEADRIARAHPEAFRAFGYDHDADASLSGTEADENWESLVRFSGWNRGAA